MRPDDAVKDYSKAISLIKGPGGDSTDPSELPAAM
jgi:hypothetical protein